MSVTSVTVWCIALRRVVHLHTGSTSDSGEWWLPYSDKMFYTEPDHPHIGALVLKPVSNDSVLVTVDVGPVVIREGAQQVYDGPMKVATRFMSVQDGEGSVDHLPYAFEPGRYRVVVQVTGRDEAEAKDEEKFARIQAMSDEELAAYDNSADNPGPPLEHWYITFPEVPLLR